MGQNSRIIVSCFVIFFFFECAAIHRPIASLSPKVRSDVTYLTAITNVPGQVDVNENDAPSIPPWLPSFGTAALGGLLFGSDIGCSSSVVRIFGTGLTDFGQLDSFQLGLLASTSLFGAMAASAVLIFLGDKDIGRKLELQIASSLFLLGTFLQSLSPSLALVYFGRVVFGLGIGTAMHVAPLYIAETSPDNLRGKLVSLKEAAIVGSSTVLFKFFS